MFALGEILEGSGETLELALQNALHRKLPPTGAVIPPGIQTEILTLSAITTGLGVMVRVRMKVIEIP